MFKRMSLPLLLAALLLALVLWLVLRSPEAGPSKKPVASTVNEVAARPEPTRDQQAPPQGPRPGSVPETASVPATASMPEPGSVPPPPTPPARDDLRAPLSWASMPALGRATGAARAGQYAGSFDLVDDTCGDMPATTTREFETALVDGALVIQFTNDAGWSCEITGAGAFECPTLEEGKTESEGKTPHVERAARGVWRIDGSIQIQVQTRTWCEGPRCDDAPCHWSFDGTLHLRD